MKQEVPEISMDHSADNLGFTRGQGANISTIEFC